jgi:hypothetical protein
MKNELKANYIKRLREQSAYPALRLSLEITFWITILASLGCFFTACLLFARVNGDLSYPPLVSAMLFIIFLPFFGLLARESGSLLIDIADSITDLNSRYEGQ